jgi:outer membrane protein assembly factor BamB
VECGAVVCGERVAFGSDDGRLYVLALADGRKLWSYEVGAAVSTPIAVAAGLLLAGADDGRLYAFGAAP